MNQRKLIIGGIGGLILVGSIVLSNYFAGRDNTPPEIETENSAVVKTKEVKNGAVQSKISITGRLQASDKIDLYAEVSGICSFGSQDFKTGNSFKKGQILLKIDDAEFRSNLISSKSEYISLIASVLPDVKLDFPSNFDAFENYLNSIEIYQSLPELPEINDKKLRLFLSGRGVFTSYYKIREAETRLSKYNIKAPYSGTLTESFVNNGALVRIGQQLGEFIRTGDYELEASIPAFQIKYLKEGMEVSFKEITRGGEFKSKLIRINQKVDPATQMVKVFFNLKSNDLRTGMYMEATVDINSFQDAMRLPLSSLVDGNYIYTIDKNNKAVKSKIRLLEQGTEEIIVSGLSDGQKVITDKKNSSFEGTEVIEM